MEEKTTRCLVIGERWPAWFSMAVVVTVDHNVEALCSDELAQAVGSMCHTIERTDRQTGFSELLGLRSKPELLPYHSSLLTIYIKAAMLVFDL
jgi:hypothetical protein